MRLDTLISLADALHVTPAEMLGGANPRTKRPAPTGRRRGKPRTMRRQGFLGEIPMYDEDEELTEEVL